MSSQTNPFCYECGAEIPGAVVRPPRACRQTATRIPIAELRKLGVKVETVALAGYGVEKFLEVFYRHLGRAYMEQHAAGLQSFLQSVSGCAGMTRSADECREFLEDQAKQTMKKR